MESKNALGGGASGCAPSVNPWAWSSIDIADCRNWRTRNTWPSHPGKPTKFLTLCVHWIGTMHEGLGTGNHMHPAVGAAQPYDGDFDPSKGAVSAFCDSFWLRLDSISYLMGRLWNDILMCLSVGCNASLQMSRTGVTNSAILSISTVDEKKIAIH